MRRSVAQKVIAGESMSPFDFINTKEGPIDVISFTRNKVDQQIQEWTVGLEKGGLRDFEICKNGAIATGLFRGAKQRNHSLNSTCPEEYSHVIEGDLRIILPENEDLEDKGLRELVAHVTGSQFEKVGTTRRWNQQIKMAFFYGYENLGKGLGFETEICLNTRPYLEIADSWPIVFSPEEVRWQADLRQLLRAADVNYAEFTTLKESQVAECRYRIISAYALREYSRQDLSDEVKNQIILPPNHEKISGETPQLVKPLVGRWLLGESGLSGYNAEELNKWIKGQLGDVGLDRPFQIASVHSITKIAEINPSLLTPPPEPKWVTYASNLQKKIRAKL